ncbi:hypothetical protein [Aggregatilinea lenta]|uniref:hypothetical protein n=1 Tax=Aggregatilinea lenta TaxID=913108 RepID=UPI000E5AB4D1|nr:hypothetical protein [Aggregatilinea lenta]
MLNSWRLKANNRLVAWAGVLGVGLLPCPDCGLPLGIKIWPVAAGVWVFRRLARRSMSRMDLLLTGDLADHAGNGHDHGAEQVNMNK